MAQSPRPSRICHFSPSPQHHLLGNNICVDNPPNMALHALLHELDLYDEYDYIVSIAAVQ